MISANKVYNFMNVGELYQFKAWSSMAFFEITDKQSLCAEDLIRVKPNSIVLCLQDRIEEKWYETYDAELYPMEKKVRGQLVLFETKIIFIELGSLQHFEKIELDGDS